jgi:hypothetical protein
MNFESSSNKFDKAIEQTKNMGKEKPGEPKVEEPTLQEDFEKEFDFEKIVNEGTQKFSEKVNQEEEKGQAEESEISATIEPEDIETGYEGDQEEDEIEDLIGENIEDEDTSEISGEDEFLEESEEGDENREETSEEESISPEEASATGEGSSEAESTPEKEGILSKINKLFNSKKEKNLEIKENLSEEKKEALKNLLKRNQKLLIALGVVMLGASVAFPLVGGLPVLGMQGIFAAGSSAAVAEQSLIAGLGGGMVMREALRQSFKTLLKKES